MEIYTFLKGRQDNKWCSLKKFDFQTGQKKWDGGSIYIYIYIERERERERDRQTDRQMGSSYTLCNSKELHLF